MALRQPTLDVATYHRRILVFRISREEAAEIAERFLEDSGRRSFSIRNIWDIWELKLRRPNPHFVTHIRWDHCWIAYLEGPLSGIMLKSSDIIVISKETGEILYSGDANDEG